MAAGTDRVFGDGNLTMGHVTTIFQTQLMALTQEADIGKASRQYGDITWFSEEEGAANPALKAQLRHFMEGREPLPEDYQPEQGVVKDVTLGNQRALILYEAPELLHKGTADEQVNSDTELVTHFTTLYLRKTEDGKIEYAYADSLRGVKPEGHLDTVPEVIQTILAEIADEMNVELGEQQEFESTKQGSNPECGYHAAYHALQMTGLQPQQEDIRTFITVQRAFLEAESGVSSTMSRPSDVEYEENSQHFSLPSVDRDQYNIHLDDKSLPERNFSDEHIQVAIEKYQEAHEGHVDGGFLAYLAALSVFFNDEVRQRYNYVSKPMLRYLGISSKDGKNVMVPEDFKLSSIKAAISRKVKEIIQDKLPEGVSKVISNRLKNYLSNTVSLENLSDEDYKILTMSVLTGRDEGLETLSIIDDIVNNTLKWLESTPEIMGKAIVKQKDSNAIYSKAVALIKGINSDKKNQLDSFVSKTCKQFFDKCLTKFKCNITAATHYPNFAKLLEELFQDRAKLKDRQKVSSYLYENEERFREAWALDIAYQLQSKIEEHEVAEELETEIDPAEIKAEILQAIPELSESRHLMRPIAENKTFRANDVYDVLVTILLENTIVERVVKNKAGVDTRLRFSLEMVTRIVFGENQHVSNIRELFRKRKSEVGVKQGTVDNLGSYEEIKQIIKEIKEHNDCTDADIAKCIKDVLKGKKLDETYTEMTTEGKNRILDLTTLLFFYESIRDIGNITAAKLLVDKVANENISWDEAIDQLPVSMKGAISASRKLNLFYNKYIPKQYQYLHDYEYTDPSKADAVTLKSRQDALFDTFIEEHGLQGKAPLEIVHAMVAKIMEGQEQAYEVEEAVTTIQRSFRKNLVKRTCRNQLGLHKKRDDESREVRLLLEARQKEGRDTSLYQLTIAQNEADKQQSKKRFADAVTNPGQGGLYIEMLMRSREDLGLKPEQPSDYER